MIRCDDVYRGAYAIRVAMLMGAFVDGEAYTAAADADADADEAGAKSRWE